MIYSMKFILCNLEYKFYARKTKCLNMLDKVGYEKCI